MKLKLMLQIWNKIYCYLAIYFEMNRYDHLKYKLR